MLQKAGKTTKERQENDVQDKSKKVLPEKPTQCIPKPSINLCVSLRHGRAHQKGLMRLFRLMFVYSFLLLLMLNRRGQDEGDADGDDR